MILTSDQPLSIHIMGRAFRITAVYTNVDEANSYMEANPGQGVIAVYGSLIFISDTSDPGLELTKVN